MKRFFLLFALVPIILNAQIIDDFSDGNISTNLQWYGDTGYYEILNPPTSGNGSINAEANNDSLVLRSKQYMNDAIIITESSISAGEWKFSVADGRGWTISNTNDYKIILMADDSTRANLVDGNHNFNGYFFQFDGGNSDKFTLYKQTGTITTELINTNYPINNDGSTPIARTVKIIRDTSNTWSVYIDEGFETDPETLRGIPIIDAEHLNSSFFGIATNISSPSDIRTLYFDNLYIGPINYDTIAPEIISVELISANELHLFFNEELNQTTAEENSNYFVDNGIGSPSIASLDDDTAGLVKLGFTNSFPEGIECTLTINNVTDTEGNAIENEQICFTYIAPIIAEYRDIIINEIFADPFPQVSLPEVEYIEIFNISNKTFNLESWQFTDQNSIATFSPYAIEPNNYLIICSNEDTSLFSSFGEVMGVSSWPSLNNSGDNLHLLDNTGNIIDSINYSTFWYQDPEKDNGGWSLELINPTKEDGCPMFTNWTASMNSSGGTPGQQNSVYSTDSDITPPNVTSISAISSDTIQITFSEPMDYLQLSNTSNYEIDNTIANPIEIQINEQYSSVLLILSSHLLEGIEYSVNISNQLDCSGNAMNNFHGQFFHSVANNKDVIINEIFADPYPQVALPLGEFVEIYNNSNKPFDLCNWKLGFNTVLKNLPSYVLQPYSYVTICDNDYQSEYETFGDVIPIPSFPSLTNAGGTLYLFSKDEVMIDSVSYDESYYKDSEKEKGGWTLELINPNPNINCLTYNNWAASMNLNGGTPCETNSIYNNAPDTTAPKILYIEVLNELQIKICFDETIDAVAISNHENYSVNNRLGNPMIIEPNISLTEATLTFSMPIEQKIEYTLTTENISDCSGNFLQNHIENFMFYLPKIYDITFNEIMADPSPVVALPDGDYLELYNKTPYPINLKGWTLVIGNTIKEIEDNVFIGGNDYIVFCDNDKLNLFEPYGKCYSFPSLTLADENGFLILKDAGSKLMHFVNYKEEWYDLDGKKDGGWSLEQIDPNNPCGAESNWTGSQDNKGGTPAKENSVFTSNLDYSQPELVRVSYIDSTTITAYFSEILDTIPIRDVNAYIVDNNIGNPVNVIPIFPDYSSVMLKFKSKFKKSTVYTLNVVDSIKDCAGNYIAALTSSRFAVPEMPEKNDLIVNEILHNPKENGVDFIEIYNRSDKVIDLKHLRLASFDEYEQKLKDMSVIAPDGWLIFPMEYYVLTSSPITVKKQYYSKNPKAFIKMKKFPSFPNNEGEVIISMIDSTYIDNVIYTDNMHFQLLGSTEGVSLERLNFDRASSDESNWLSASESANFATPGFLNSQYNQNIGFKGDITIEPEIFSPDNDGYNDVLNIGYQFSEPGYTMNIEIFDAKGHSKRKLVSNKYLGTKAGTVSWDGITNDNEKANVGIYIIYIEVFDLEGNIRHYKKTATLATRF